MTWLQGVLVKIVMLAVAVGLLFWAVKPERTAEPEPATMVPSPSAETQGEDEPGEAPQVQPAQQAQPTQRNRPHVQEDAPPSPARTVAASSARTAPPSPPRRSVTFPLDINRAPIEEFMALPGIGEELARRVVEYRKRHGGFRSVDELRKVRGIGEKRMEQLRPLVVTAEAP